MWIEGTLKLESNPEAYAYPLLIKRILESAPRYAPDQAIYMGKDKVCSYKELPSRVASLCDSLSKKGLKPSDRIGVMDWDSHRYLDLFFAVPCLGSVLHTINVRLSASQIVWTINHAQDRFLFVHPDFLPLIESSLDSLESVERVFVYGAQGERSNHPKLAYFEYEELIDSGSEKTVLADFDEDSVATLFYTTGTTGDPKAVYFTHRQLVLHTMALSQAIGCYDDNRIFSSNDVYMPLTPMFHVHAWGIPYVATLLGAKQVYPGRYEPSLILDLIESHQVTFSHCVPAILQMILNHPKSEKMDLGHWKVVIGGSAFSPGLAKAAMQKGIDAYSGYGMSETCPVLSLTHLSFEERELPLDEQVDIRVRAGVPIPFVDLGVVSSGDSNPSTESGASGEVVARTPWLTQNYYLNEEAGNRLWTDGWLHTGDVGEMDGSCLKITDRIKDVIKSGGEWISSVDLERRISRVDGVKDVAVVGVEDVKWGERPVVWYISETPNHDSILDALSKDVKEGTLSKWAIPEIVERVEEIPRTSVGKTDKKRIRQILLERGSQV